MCSVVSGKKTGYINHLSNIKLGIQIFPKIFGEWKFTRKNVGKSHHQHLRPKRFCGNPLRPQTAHVAEFLGIPGATHGGFWRGPLGNEMQKKRTDLFLFLLHPMKLWFVSWGSGKIQGLLMIVDNPNWRTVSSSDHPAHSRFCFF